MVASVGTGLGYWSWLLVSIPFIAGQWSLRASAPTSPSPASSLNPLHCGAVVASNYLEVPMVVTKSVFQSPSLRGSGRFRSRCYVTRWHRRSFNPLHCGAVVASTRLRTQCGGVWEVSIPFIAGQWSLHADRLLLPRALLRFQSPSLRGSGRFERARKEAADRERASQSPSLRGSGRFVLALTILVLIMIKFQSPSLRGSGRFKLLL